MKSGKHVSLHPHITCSASSLALLPTTNIQPSPHVIRQSPTHSSSSNMSSSSSALLPSKPMPSASRPSHSRHPSIAQQATPQQQQDLRPSKVPSPKPPSSRRQSVQGNIAPPPAPAQVQVPAKSNVHYTCFIRLPFPRNDFEDPPPVEWDTGKDRALWKLISKASNSKVCHFFAHDVHRC